MSLWMNQSEKKSRTVSLWINQSEKKSRTVSQWINQSENVPCERVKRRDKPARQEEQKKNRVNVYRKTRETGIEENFVIFQMAKFFV